MQGVYKLQILHFKGLQLCFYYKYLIQKISTEYQRKKDNFCNIQLIKNLTLALIVSITFALF